MKRNDNLVILFQEAVDGSPEEEAGDEGDGQPRKESDEMVLVNIHHYPCRCRYYKDYNIHLLPSP